MKVVRWGKFPQDWSVGVAAVAAHQQLTLGAFPGRASKASRRDASTTHSHPG